MTEKSVLSIHEAEEYIRGMGREAAVVVHNNGLVTATAISATPGDPKIQNEVDEMLREIQRRYRIVRSRR